MTRRRVRSAVLAVVTTAILGLAIPALAAEPSPPPGNGEAEPARPGRSSHKVKVAGEPLTLTRLVAQSTDAKGRPIFL